MDDNANSCASCKTSLPVGANYCHACGRPIAGAGLFKDGEVGISRNLMIGGGVLAALLIAGGSYYLIAGGSGAVGPNFEMIGPGLGEADRDGDGEISISEFGQELAELKMPSPGRWKYTIGGAAPDAASESNYVRYSGESEFCDARTVREMEESYEEMRDPENFEEMERDFRELAGGEGGDATIDHFTIDGDNVAFRMSGSGEQRGFLMRMDGTGEFAVSGIVSEDRIDLQSPLFLDMAMSGPTLNMEGEMEIRINAVYLLDAERIGDCPPGWDDPVPEEQEFPEPPTIMVVPDSRS